MNNCNLSKVFIEGQILHSNFGLMHLKPYKVGELFLTSGKLVACDPLVFPGTEPFDVNFKPGYYPVILSIACNEDKRNPLVAFAKVCVSEEKVAVRWQMATKAGENLASLRDGQVFGYAVDSGTGCFMDADTSQIIVDDTWDSEIYEETLAYKLVELLEEQNDLGVSCGNMCVNNTTRANIIAFEVGIGDGFYYSCFGYDIHNKVVEIVTICINFQ
jgi:hypothetical protein